MRDSMSVELEDRFLDEEFGEELEVEVATSIAIGIDLGTTNSVVMYYQDGLIKPVKFGSDFNIPSAIYFESPSEILFGRQAVNKQLFKPESGVRYFKRRLGDLENPYFEVKYGKQIHKAVNVNRSYVIDTNILLDNPEIFAHFTEGDQVYLPATVVSELNYQADRKENLRFQAEKALQMINEFSDYITNMESNLNIIPTDIFNGASNSNDENDLKILSISMQIAEQTPILITNDYALLQHAKTVGIEAKNYDDFRVFKLMNENAGETFKIHAQQLTQLFLQHLRETAMNALKENITKVAIGVPVEFTPAQEDATRNAAYAAGFEEVELVRESFAAAIAYGHDVSIGKKILVYDWGGGTFDVSIIEILENKEFKHLGHDGDGKLGGEDITKKITEKICDIIEDEHNVFIPEIHGLSTEEMKKNEVAIYKVAEECKIQLSVINEVVMPISIFVSSGNRQSFDVRITRQQFEQWIGPFVKQTIDRVANALQEAGLTFDDIDIAVLAGGTSLIPCIQKAIEEQFGFTPYYDKDASKLIAEGAAIFVGKAEIGNPDTVYEVTNHHFGVLYNKIDFENLIPAGTELPFEASTVKMPLTDYAEELVINVYRASKSSAAQYTTDKGMERIEKLTITNIPPRPKTDIGVDITFELTKKYGLTVNAVIRDRSSDEILNTAYVQKQSAY
jgi:molecular chaperone DnaK (HSP70)